MIIDPYLPLGLILGTKSTCRYSYQLLCLVMLLLCSHNLIMSWRLLMLSRKNPLSWLSLGLGLTIRYPLM